MFVYTVHLSHPTTETQHNNLSVFINKLLSGCYQQWFTARYGDNKAMFTLAEASHAPDTKVLWSGLRERNMTSPVWPAYIVICWPVSTSQVAQVMSPLLVTIWLSPRNRQQDRYLRGSGLGLWYSNGDTWWHSLTPHVRAVPCSPSHFLPWYWDCRYCKCCPVLRRPHSCRWERRRRSWPRRSGGGWRAPCWCCSCPTQSACRPGWPTPGSSSPRPSAWRRSWPGDPSASSSSSSVSSRSSQSAAWPHQSLCRTSAFCHSKTLSLWE